MEESPWNVSMVDVARAAQVHKTTVSRALRGDPSIPAKTRERIRELADVLGYRTNPLVSALMKGRRRPRASRSPATIGVLVPQPGIGEDSRFAGLKKRAEFLGFNVDEIVVPPGTSSGRIAEIARARGIRGLIIVGNPEPGGPRGLLPHGWQDLAAVALGPTCPWSGFPTVRADLVAGLCQALDVLEDRGFQRVGLVSHPSFERQVVGRQRGLFLHRWRDWPTEQQVEPFDVGGEAWTQGNFKRWLREQRPDALLGGDCGAWCVWAREAGLPLSRIVVLDRIPGLPYPGIDQQRLAQQTAAVDTLASLLYHGDFGPAEHKATSILIPGIWRD